MEAIVMGLILLLTLIISFLIIRYIQVWSFDELHGGTLWKQFRDNLDIGIWLYNFFISIFQPFIVVITFIFTWWQTDITDISELLELTEFTTNFILTEIIGVILAIPFTLVMRKLKLEKIIPPRSWC